jgi:hypothetical protein
VLADQPPYASGSKVVRCVLDRVVKQRRDGFVFGSAEVERQRRDTQQVGHVRRPFALPPLPGVQFCRENERVSETAADLAAFVGNERSG